MKKNEAISILATSVRPREQKDRARYDEAVKMAIDALNEPERKMGKWIIEGFPTCSICKGDAPHEWDYCPNCGARMMQEGEGHDS